MARRGEHDRGKERFWRRMLRPWRRSGLSIRDYCVAHDLAESSFYGWRRTIAERDQQARRPPDRDGTIPAGRQQRGRSTSAPPLFVPVHIAAAVGRLEVVLDSGRVVRVPVGFDSATLRQLLAVLEAAAPC